MCLGDWHYGEVVRPSEAGGYRFDSTIAEDRIRRTIEKTVSLTRDALAGLEYPGIVCALLGDMTSGALHPELAESDEYSVFMSILRVRDLIVASIRSLADEFGRVFVPTAVGNHGRTFDRKPRAKGYAERNSDWLVYQLVAREFQNDPRVTVMVPDAGETVFRVYGKTFLLSHGDMLGTKGGDGIIGALGPIMRGSMKTLRSVASLGLDIDHLIVGHWHQSIYLPQVTVNGTIKGPDEYALKFLRAPAEDPSQTLMVMHPQHGLTFRQPIFLRDEPARTGPAQAASLPLGRGAGGRRVTDHAEPDLPSAAARRMRAARARLAKAKDHDAALELQHATRAHAESSARTSGSPPSTPLTSRSGPPRPDHLEALLACPLVTMHALRFRFRTPEWRSCWLYVTADPHPDPTAATLKARHAALPDLLAVLDRSPCSCQRMTWPALT